MNAQPTTITEKIVPFQVARNEMLSLFTKWLRDSMFAPANVASRIQTRDLIAIFAPIYECSCEYVSNWQGEWSVEFSYPEIKEYSRSSYEEYYDIHPPPTIRQVREKIWHKNQGTFSSNQKQVVAGSDFLRQSMYESLSPYDFGRNVAASSSIIGNGTKIATTFDSDRAWNLAWPQIYKQASEELVKKRITERVLDLQVQYTKQETTIIYLPLWFWEFEFGGKQFTAFINGQTGKIVGSRPSDPLKQWGCILIIGSILFVLSLSFVASVVIATLMQR